MGCNFQTLIFSGTYDKETLQSAFDGRVQESRYEDGNSYSGEIGMATGLIIEDLEFASYDEAFAWLDDHCIKWEEARAVKFTNSKGTWWFIGAQCAS